MANQSGNFGLRPSRMLGGTPFNNSQNRYRILKNYGSAIFQGDLVAASDNGTIIVAGATTNPVVEFSMVSSIQTRRLKNLRSKITILVL